MPSSTDATTGIHATRGGDLFLSDMVTEGTRGKRLVFALRLFRANYNDVRITLRAIFNPSMDASVVRAFS